jgi:hypothetical protein
MKGSSKPSSASKVHCTPRAPKPERLAGARQAVQGRALRGHVRQLAQFAEGDVDAVVTAQHRQAGRAAIHLLGLLDQGKALDDLLARLRL